MLAIKEKQPLIDQPQVESVHMDERLIEDLEDLIRFREKQIKNGVAHTTVQEELAYFKEELYKLLTLQHHNNDND